MSFFHCDIIRLIHQTIGVIGFKAAALSAEDFRAVFQYSDNARSYLTKGVKLYNFEINGIADFRAIQSFGNYNFQLVGVFGNPAPAFEFGLVS